MSTYSIPELAYLIREAGFSNVEWWTAIAWRESRGVATVIGDINNPSAGCKSYGLFQINVCPSGNNAGIPWRERPEPVLLTARGNIAAAFEMSNRGTNDGPWMTYRSGIAQPPVAEVAAALKAAGGPKAPADGGGTSTPTTSDSTTSTPAGGGDLSKLTNPETWSRVAWAIGGAVCLVVGLMLLANETAQGAGRALISGGKPKPKPKPAPEPARKRQPSDPLPGESPEQLAQRLDNLAKKET